ncbi:MAG: alpha/beta fold hydrolase [Kineosporiaceae bacterium]
MARGDVFRRPDRASAGLATTWLTTTDGVRISAHHDPGPAGWCFVVVHGFTGSWRRPDIRRVAAGLGRHGGVVAFDLRGHGASGGECTAGDAEVLDLDAVLAWVAGLGYRHVAVVGFSLGAAVALRHAALAAQRRPDVLVAVSGPGRWYYRGTPAMRRVQLALTTGLGRAVVRRFFGTRVSGRDWDAEPLPPGPAAARLAEAGVPLLLVHGEADRYFPPEHAVALADAARAAAPGGAPVDLWLVPGMGHAEGAVDEDLLQAVVAWVTSRVPSGGPPGG